MSITTTRLLKLKIDSRFDEVSKFNLNKIDTLASIFQVNSNQEAVVRSQTSILIQPNSPDIGGNGVGGDVTIGSANQPITNFTVNASNISFGGGTIRFQDTAAGGTKGLSIAYKSDLAGLVDTIANRTLSLDVQGSDRSLILGGNFSLLNNALTLTVPVSTSWTLPATSGTSGQVLTTDGAGVLSWESASGASQQAIVIWDNSDGTTKNIAHSLNSQNLNIQVLDSSANYATIEVDSITRPNNSLVQLTSSHAPSTNWVVILNKIS